MHELGVTENIINISLAKTGEAQASKVIRITLVVGELSGFVPDCIQFYFDTLSKDTIAQGAILHFESVPTQLRCRDCAATFPPQDAPWACPKCKGQNVDISQGRELYIEAAGFIISSTILFWCTARAFGGTRCLRDLAIGVVLAFASYQLFTRGLALSLPAGILDRLF